MKERAHKSETETYMRNLDNIRGHALSQVMRKRFHGCHALGAKHRHASTEVHAIHDRALLLSAAKNHVEDKDVQNLKTEFVCEKCGFHTFSRCEKRVRFSGWSSEISRRASWVVPKTILVVLNKCVHTGHI